MRVAFIINSLGFGGTEKQLLYLAEGLKSKGITPRVFYFLNRHELVEDFRKSGIDTFCVKAQGSVKYFRYISIFRITVREVSRFKPDIIQSFSLTANNFAILCGILTGTPVITGERNIDIPMSLLARMIRIILYRFSYRLICNSKAVEKWSRRQYLLPKEKTEVVFNGIDTTKALTLEAEKESINILTIASFKPQKGHIYLVHAIPKVISHFKSMHFIFVGEGSEKGKIEELSRRMGIDDFISFQGSTSDIGTYYRKADLFCLPSLSEGMPNVIMEAMVYGLPIVATDTGGTSELIIPEKTGLLVKPGRPDELSSAIIRMLDDKTLRLKLGKNAQEHIKSFGLDEYVQKYISLYKRTKRKKALFVSQPPLPVRGLSTVI